MAKFSALAVTVPETLTVPGVPLKRATSAVVFGQTMSVVPLDQLVLVVFHVPAPPLPSGLAPPAGVRPGSHATVAASDGDEAE